MKNQYLKNNWIHIIVYGCSGLMFLLLLFTLLEIHFNTPKIWTTLNESSLPSRFPLSEESREHLLENSDVHFKYHNSIITVFSLIIAAVGILLTFAAFYIQYVFNYRQKVDLSKERFENQFFHLLDVSRELCHNIYIPNVGKGKLAFHYMFYEYKAIFNLINELELINTKDPEIINKIAFCIFINGVSRGFKPDINSEMIDTKKLETMITRLLNLQANSEMHGKGTIIDSGIRYLRDYKGRHIKYFDGHRSRLIHYFNYIFLILSHISDKEKDKNTCDIDMMIYFCGEFTEHELGLLYAYIHYCNNEDKEKYEPYIEYLLQNSDIAHKLKFNSNGFLSPILLEESIDLSRRLNYPEIYY